MKNKAVYYHAGCPVCQEVEREFLNLLNCETEVVHLGQNRSRIQEAKAAGVKSVPTLVVNNKVYHINFGANLSDI
jgi:glutaredoxin